MNFKDAFSELSVHGLVYKDDFYAFAHEIRRELLDFPDWFEMEQGFRDVRPDVFQPHRQNGITTGHLGRGSRERLPRCMQFSDFLDEHIRELCQLTAVECPADPSVEINAMAYGEGAWLSGHTDYGLAGGSDERVIAWMLYLTEPNDGEWSADMGGAARLWIPGGPEVRVRPKFNRFAIFRVNEQSFHAVEQVAFKTGWNRSRLALSGWIRARTGAPPQSMKVYRRSSDYRDKRDHLDATLRGSLALYELMLQQRAHCGLDTDSTSSRVAQLRERYEAHLTSPLGTTFVRYIPGPEGCMLVVNEEGKVDYLGPFADYEGEEDNASILSPNAKA